MLRVTIWMNMPSVHQDGLFNALAALGEIDLRVIFARELTQDRVQLGWEHENRIYSNRTLSRRNRLLDAIRIARSERDRLHVINGIWAEPAFAATLCALALSRSKFAVYAESPEPGQARQKFKEVMKRTFGRWVARHALGILSVSRFAHNYYTRLGFRKDQIYPFGYFRSDDNRVNLSNRPANKNRTEVVFVGQLIHRKGIDILIEAIRPLFAEYPDLQLTLIGAGDKAAQLEKQAASSGLQGRIVFEGVMPSNRIQARLATADLLALPSRWDGWGMVVNEAFSVGVPVLVSDQCGASDLIQPGINGYVFRSEDAEDLRDCLRRFLDRRDERAAMRSAARNTGRAISAEAIAPYLIECLNSMTGASDRRPVPPWAQLATLRSADR
jgi:glycosyltransferase involved in cell wall biosynthesis